LRQRADPQAHRVEPLEAARDVVRHDGDEAGRKPALRHEGGSGALRELLHHARGRDVLREVEVVHVREASGLRDMAREVEGRGGEHRVAPLEGALQRHGVA
jgi:hypothetical protein